jgi:hypothetical protein
MMRQFAEQDLHGGIGSAAYPRFLLSRNCGWLIQPTALDFSGGQYLTLLRIQDQEKTYA